MHYLCAIILLLLFLFYGGPKLARSAVDKGQDSLGVFWFFLWVGLWILVIYIVSEDIGGGR